MYQVDVTATCQECGKQWKVRKICGSLRILIANLLDQIQISGFVLDNSVCKECAEKDKTEVVKEEGDES